MEQELVDVRSPRDWAEYHALRRTILFLARGRTGYDANHPDDVHPSHYPLLLKRDGRALGTVRLDDFGNGTGAVRQVTIATDRQRQGHVRVLSDLLEQRARAVGLRTLFVNAAPDAVGYYAKTGWEPFIWNTDELTGFAADCVQMRKILASRS